MQNCKRHRQKSENTVRRHMSHFHHITLLFDARSDSVALKAQTITFLLGIRSPPTCECWISPRKIGQQSLRYFSTLTNVQQLWIEWFNRSTFFPDIRWCSGTSHWRCNSSGTQQRLLCFLTLPPNLIFSCFLVILTFAGLVFTAINKQYFKLQDLQGN